MGAALVAVAMTACGKGDKAAADGSDTLVAKEISDSIMHYYGLQTAAYMAQQVAYYNQSVPDSARINKDDFIKGLLSVVGDDRNNSYMAGVNMGLRMYQDIEQMREQGVQINRDKLSEAVKEVFAADSVTDEQAQEYVQKYREMIEKVQQAAADRADARAAASPAAIQNGRTAAAVVDSLRRTNPAFKTSESGLGYIIENPGTEPKVSLNDRVSVKYVGKHLDGKVFDQNDDAMMTPGNGLIPGFVEALQMLGQGGKGTFYIPGNLAYGNHGAPDGGIGPNETLVFELEVNSITPSNLPQEQTPAQ